MYNPLKVSLDNIIPLTEARDHFSQIVNEVQKDKLYILTKGGKPAVAIVDVKYLEHITGGEAKVEQVRDEIKKAPEKVGLAPMVQHPPAGKPTPPPPAPAGQSPLGGAKPFTPPAPKPAGFAAPQPSAPPSKPPEVKPPQPAGQTPSGDSVGASPLGGAAPQPPQAPNPTLKMPGEGVKDENAKIDVKLDAPVQEEPPKDKFTSLDDQTSPSQYDGKANKDEPEDMSID